MFRRLPDLGGETVNFTIDGRPATARTGDTVAAALLASGVESCRTTPVSGAPRAPYCMMGVCFECLVTIDGVGNRQGCLISVTEGMVVQSQKGARAIASEHIVDGDAA
jgi:predicted molibdopterin-dependent oxidoreductase YjgC